MRHDGRAHNELRPVSFELNTSRHAEGSCIITCGGTKVWCTASVEESVPHFMKNSGKGWVTAEYSMLPRATHTRIDRESTRGKVTGRTQEIQRLIGRSLRSIVDMQALGERQILIDCDVLQADGGTRTASITGAFVALSLALHNLKKAGKIEAIPLHGALAAVSCGIVGDVPMLDLNYEEDSVAEMDANFVLTSDGKIIELQCTAEATPIEESQFAALHALAREGVAKLCALQQEALASL